jgi:hydroxymethylglutaryl-CoA lyase
VLCDTDGTANPVDVDSAVQLARNYTDPLGNLAVHLHHSENVFDNLQAAYDAGVREFDSSIGGIGGCPFVKGAEANLATEELVMWCNRRGIDCGVKLRDLRPALKIIDRIKYQKPRSRLRYHIAKAKSLILGVVR